MSFHSYEAAPQFIGIEAGDHVFGDAALIKYSNACDIAVVKSGSTQGQTYYMRSVRDRHRIAVKARPVTDEISEKQTDQIIILNK